MIATDQKCQAGSNADTTACVVTFASDNASVSPSTEPENDSHFENAISRALKASTRTSRQHQKDGPEEQDADKVEGSENDVRPIPSDDGAIPAPAILHPFVLCPLPSLETSSNGRSEAKAVSRVLPEATEESPYEQKTEQNVAPEIPAGCTSAHSVPIGFTDKQADTGINSAQISATMRDPAKTGQNQHALPSKESDVAKSEWQVISTLQFDATEDVIARVAVVEEGPSPVSLSGVNAELPVATFSAQFDSTDSIVEAPATTRSEIPTAEAAAQIVQCAVQMRRHHLETMTVALRPDNHTEIRLDLFVQGGQVNVQAQLERGEFGVIAQRWSELQDELSSRGVRLSNLQDSSWMTANGNGRNHYSGDDEEEYLKGQDPTNVQRSTPNPDTSGRRRFQRSTETAWECWA